MSSGGLSVAVECVLCTLARRVKRHLGTSEEVDGQHWRSQWRCCKLIQPLNWRLRVCDRQLPFDIGGDTQHSVRVESIHAWSECDGNREIYYYAHSTRRGGWTYKLSFHGCDQHGRDSRGVRSSATGTFSTARGASGRQWGLCISLHNQQQNSKKSPKPTPHKLTSLISS